MSESMIQMQRKLVKERELSGMLEAALERMVDLANNGGPCEHAFDGATEYDDGGCMVWTRVCSKCGCTALSHDMHNMW